MENIVVNLREEFCRITKCMHNEAGCLVFVAIILRLAFIYVDNFVMISDG